LWESTQKAVVWPWRDDEDGESLVNDDLVGVECTSDGGVDA
jgi:hypothetical protein